MKTSGAQAMNFATIVHFVNNDVNLTGDMSVDVTRPPITLIESLQRHIESAGAKCDAPCERGVFAWEFGAEVFGRKFVIILYLSSEWNVVIKQEGLFNFLRATRTLDEAIEWLVGNVESWASSLAVEGSKPFITKDWAPWSF